MNEMVAQLFAGGALSTAIYQQTALIVLLSLFASGLIVFFLRQSNYYFVVSWASIKSWLFFAPGLLVVFGLPQPWPLVFLTLIALLGAKIFFQLMGMYHRNYFVVACYLGILGLGYCISQDREDLYNLIPMMVVGLSCLIPLVRNNYVRMIQYISLTNLAFVFLGWAFLHLGLIMKFPNGFFQLMYLIILTEFCDNTNLALSRTIGRTHLFQRIDQKRTLESTVISGILTLGMAFLMRHLLPDGSDQYWLLSGIVASVGGLFGDLVMTVIRKDAGIKVVGAFILGRGDFLRRMDRLIFVAPIYYYVMKALPLL